MGVVGTAHLAVGVQSVEDLYVVDPERLIDLERVEQLLFSEWELEPLP